MSRFRREDNQLAKFQLKISSARPNREASMWGRRAINMTLLAEWR